MQMNKQFLFWISLMVLMSGLFGLSASLTQSRRIQRGFTSLEGVAELSAQTHNLRGINTHLLDRTPAEQQLALNTILESGFGWIRQSFSWAALEPEPGQYNWPLTDSLFDSLQDTNLMIVAVLQDSPAWARPDSPDQSAPPDNVQDFANFATAFA